MFAPSDLNQFRLEESQYACHGSMMIFFFRACEIFIGIGSWFFSCIFAERILISMSWISYGHCSFLSGSMKYSISICSNSRTLKMKFRGAISFLNALPIWAIPNGSFSLAFSWTSLKFVKISWAVSGLRYAVIESSSIGPTCVVNIGLNFPFDSTSPPHLSHFAVGSSDSSTLNLFLHFLQTTAMSVKFSTWPEASQTFGFVIIAPSIPTMSSLVWTWCFHHCVLMLFFNSEPRGP